MAGGRRRRGGVCLALSLVGRRARQASPLHCPARGFTLIEMLTTVAALVIVLGLMVSLARDVRNRSAERLTQTLLARLDGLMQQYVQQHEGRPPAVQPLLDSDIEEATLTERARQNNQQFLRVLRRSLNLSGGVLSQLPLSVYDEVTLYDAWGSEVVFMPQHHPMIGMAPQNRCFFFSAGPDRRYLTREDNLYSYEMLSAEQ